MLNVVLVGLNDIDETLTASLICLLSLPNLIKLGFAISYTPSLFIVAYFIFVVLPLQKWQSLHVILIVSLITFRPSSVEIETVAASAGS